MCLVRGLVHLPHLKLNVQTQLGALALHYVKQVHLLLDQACMQAIRRHVAQITPERFNLSHLLQIHELSDAQLALQLRRFLHMGTNRRCCNVFRRRTLLELRQQRVAYFLATRWCN